MSIVIQPLKTQDDTLEKVCICIMLVEKSSLNASATLPFLCRVGIATIVMPSIPQQSARFRLAAHWEFSTTRNLRSCFHSQSTMILRLCMSWSKCVQFVWVSSKAGERSIIGRMLPVRRAGLKSICVVLLSGLIRSFIRCRNQTKKPLQTHRNIHITWLVVLFQNIWWHSSTHGYWNNLCWGRSDHYNIICRVQWNLDIMKG